MHRQEILDHVRNIVLGTHTGLFPDDVAEFASMTYDLGMDSFHLESMISRLKEEVADIEFTPWYIKASRRGHDTVGSLVDFIDERLMALPTAARARPQEKTTFDDEPKSLEQEAA
jgi:acyl carrier protein